LVKNWAAILGPQGIRVKLRARPDILIEQLRKNVAIAEADTPLLTIPNQLGAACIAHVMEAILTSVAPVLGWH